MQIEVIVQTRAEAVEAERRGVDRLELVSDIEVGGLTPSRDVIREVLRAVSIPVQVMIRPHSQHYHYDEKIMEDVLSTIEHVVASGGNGIVFGALTKEWRIDVAAVRSITRSYSGIDMTFHRAFDEVASQSEAFLTLKEYPQVKRILTSGGAANARDGRGQLKVLRELSDANGGDPEILPGAGLSPSNIGEIHTYVGARQYHFGRAVRVDASFEAPFSGQALETIFQYTK